MSGMLIGVGVALLVVGVATMWMRGKGDPTDTAAGASAASDASDTPAAPDAKAAARAETGAAQDPGAEAALDRITLEIKGMVYGAVPPFGRLEVQDGVVTFTAQSRVVGADDGGIATGDAASTIQSLGTMEFGEFSHTYDPTKVTELDVGDGEPETALQLTVDGDTHRMVGLGGRNVELASWLKARGIGA